MNLDSKVQTAQQISRDVLLEKYAKTGETLPEHIFRRAARGVAQAEADEAQRHHWEQKFYMMFLEKRAIGGGRIMSSAGTDIGATLINCFVQPVGDCATGLDEDGDPGIYEALSQAAETMRRGGGVGYNFSKLRPRGAWVNGTSSISGGPCTFMDIFDTSCKTVESAGARRGAQMGVLDCTHPDLLEFVAAKRTPGRWNNFNVSICISDAFMEHVEVDGTWELFHRAKPGPAIIANGAFQRADGMWVYSRVNAREVYDSIMKSTYDYAEPGILFPDNANRNNNLQYAEKFLATNPCAEHWLPAYGCCDLGQLILPTFVSNAFSEEASFDFAAFQDTVQTLTRFLDNVLEVTKWPLEQQRQEAQNKRRIGIGFTGLGNTLTMLGLRYDDEMGRKFAARISEVMRDAAYLASIELARERGVFPLFNSDKYLADGTCASRLPEPIKERIRVNGMRNSHLLSIAPTGTVSLAFADNASNGIEPAFSWGYVRKKRLAGGGDKHYDVFDHAFNLFFEHKAKPLLGETAAQTFKEAVFYNRPSFIRDGKEVQVSDILPSCFVTALEMTADAHLRMMEAVQPYIDASISKTVNVPADYPFEDFKGLYLDAWKAGLKGLATYRPNAILGSVLSVATDKAPEAKSKAQAMPEVPDIDPLSVVIEKRPPGRMNGITERIDYYNTEGRQSVYLTVNFQDVEGVVGGKVVTVNRPIELFLQGVPGAVPQEWVALAARTLSLVARANLLHKALADLRQVPSDRGNVRYGFYEKEDGTRVPRTHRSEVGAIAYAIQEILRERGYLDVDGNLIPTRVQAKSQLALTDAEPAQTVAIKTGLMHGIECGECGAHAVIKKDGCDYCTNCGSLGTCG